MLEGNGVDLFGVSYNFTQSGARVPHEHCCHTKQINICIIMYIAYSHNSYNIDTINREIYMYMLYNNNIATCVYNNYTCILKLFSNLIKFLYHTTRTHHFNHIHYSHFSPLSPNGNPLALSVPAQVPDRSSKGLSLKFENVLLINCVPNAHFTRHICK